MKLSIILPIYNTENYLAKCLDSVFNQDLDASEYEVILINDGSTDRSKDIILDYKRKNVNLVFIDQDNQGVSVARNAGLDIAKGEYITFVDSDDEIEQQSLKQIIEKLRNEDLDILYPNIDTYSETGDHLGSIGFKGSYNEIKSGFQNERRTYPPTFYRSEVVKDFRFNPRISFGEDTVFNVQAQAQAERVSFADIPYYKYTVRKYSLSKQGYSDKAFYGFMLAINEIFHFQQKYFSEDLQGKPYFDKVYETFVTRIIELNIMPTWNRNRYQELLELLTEHHLQYILDLFEPKYPYVAISFTKFKTYQQYLSITSLVYKLIYRA